jgi:transposase
MSSASIGAVTNAHLPLPDDAESLKALVLAMAAKAASAETELQDLKIAKASADERIARLTSILKKFLRERHGRKSEKLGPEAQEQQSFVFEDETGIAAVEAQADKARDPANRRQRDPRPRKGFAAHLERVEVVIEPEIPAEHQGKDKIKIGEDVSERLDVIPAFGGKTVRWTVFSSASLRVIITRRPKYAFKDSDGIIQALAPNHIIAGGIPTEALLAMIAVSKYADGQPLYRQEGIYARDGVEVDRSQMAQWMGIVGFEFEPLADHVLSRVKQGERSSPTRPHCRRCLPAMARPRPPGSGPMPATIDRSVAMGHQWSPIASRTVDPGSVSRPIWQATTACCKSTAIRPISGLKSPMVDGIASSSPAVGPTSGASSTIFTPMAKAGSPQLLSRG